MPAASEHEDSKYMLQALELAKSAAKLGEVPVGALVVRNGTVLSGGFNRRESLQIPLAHAEIIAVQKAAKALGSWRLTECDLYVTLEPCLMCAGALVQARLRRVIFAARDPKGGALRSLYQVGEDSRLNHRLEITEGIHADQAGLLLKEFFQKLRKPQQKI